MGQTTNSKGQITGQTGPAVGAAAKYTLTNGTRPVVSSSELACFFHTAYPVNAGKRVDVDSPSVA
jgi:hypothetical protein